MERKLLKELMSIEVLNELAPVQVQRSSGEKDNLAQVINGCIAGPLRGQALDKESMEMQSLELYIKSLKK